MILEFISYKIIRHPALIFLIINHFRDSDRMAIIPFENAVTNDDDFARRQEEYTSLLASDEKPFDFMVMITVIVAPPLSTFTFL